MHKENTSGYRGNNGNVPGQISGTMALFISEGDPRRTKGLLYARTYDYWLSRFVMTGGTKLLCASRESAVEVPHPETYACLRGYYDEAGVQSGVSFSTRRGQSRTFGQERKIFETK